MLFIDWLIYLFIYFVCWLTYLYLIPYSLIDLYVCIYDASMHADVWSAWGGSSLAGAEARAAPRPRSRFGLISYPLVI